MFSYQYVVIIYIIIFVSRVKDGNFGLLRNRLKFINFHHAPTISSFRVTIFWFRGWRRDCLPSLVVCT